VASALHQVLDALIENALQHGAGAVTLHARETHGAVAIDVEDEGTGINVTDKIFDHGVSYGGGSGIGLALAQQLTADQGGRLLLAQRRPSTRFTLIFPSASPDI
jgi:signal transduction histidine kinase